MIKLHPVPWRLLHFLVVNLKSWEQLFPNKWTQTPTRKGLTKVHVKLKWGALWSLWGIAHCNRITTTEGSSEVLISGIPNMGMNFFQLSFSKRDLLQGTNVKNWEVIASELWGRTPPSFPWSAKTSTPALCLTLTYAELQGVLPVPFASSSQHYCVFPSWDLACCVAEFTISTQWHAPECPLVICLSFIQMNTYFLELFKLDRSIWLAYVHDIWMDTEDRMFMFSFSIYIDWGGQYVNQATWTSA